MAPIDPYVPKSGDLVTVHSPCPWPGVPRGSLAVVTTYESAKRRVGFQYIGHSVGVLYADVDNVRSESDTSTDWRNEDRRFAKMLVDVYDGCTPEERTSLYTSEVMNLRARMTSDKERLVLIREVVFSERTMGERLHTILSLVDEVVPRHIRSTLAVQKKKT